jgi:hypothetical protein
MGGYVIEAVRSGVPWPDPEQLLGFSRYNHLVKVKTSITLPGELLQAIDHADSNRSSFLEKAARQYLAAIAKARRESQDAAILNARAEPLNREALDVLEYQDLG